MKTSRKLSPGISLLALAMVCVAATAEDKNTLEMHAIVNSVDLKWTPILSGWEIAVVSGNPDEDGKPFTIRFHGKDGAKVPAHWHPIDENITVLKGTFLVATGEKYDEAQLKPMNAGSFMSMPKGMRHFARAKGDTVIQAHGIGPFKINWVNPAEVVLPSGPQK